MFEPASFMLILLIFAVAEIRSMVKAKHLKEIVPYVIFMVLTGTFGIYYFSNPYREGFFYVLIKLFGIKGY